MGNPARRSKGDCSEGRFVENIILLKNEFTQQMQADTERKALLKLYEKHCKSGHAEIINHL